MTKKHVFVAVVCAVMFFTASAFAQSNEIALTAGGDFVSNKNVNVDHTWAIQGSIAHRLIHGPLVGLYGELPIAAGVNSSISRIGVGTCVVGSTTCRALDYTSLFVTPGVKLRISAPGFAPYVVVGAGLAHFGSGTTSGSQTSAAISYGGGVDFTLLPYIGVRGEIRDYNSGYPAFGFGGSGRQHNVFATGGLVLRF